MSRTTSELASRPLFFERNRVYRIYQGGALFHPLFGDPAASGGPTCIWTSC